MVPTRNMKELSCISSSSTGEWMKLNCCIFMQNCRMQKENKVPTRNMVETVLCLCRPKKQTSYHFQKYLLLSLLATSQEKVELTKKATGKTVTFSL